MNILQATKATSTNFIQSLLNESLTLQSRPLEKDGVVVNEYISQLDHKDETFVLVVSVPVSEIMNNTVNWGIHKQNATIIRL